MVEKSKVFIEGVKDFFWGMMMIVIVLIFFWSIQKLLFLFNIIWIIDINNLIFVLTISVTIGVASYMYNKNKLDKNEENLRKQTDLLIVLKEELDFLFGNLEAYKKSFSKPNHYPLYELWDIDVSLYFSNLNHKINDKETLELKKNLMKIKDKIILINNFKIEMRELEEKRGNEYLVKKIKPGELIRNQITKLIDKEILPIINNSKEEIKKLIQK